MKAPLFAYVRAASLADVFRLWSAAARRLSSRPAAIPAGVAGVPAVRPRHADRYHGARELGGIAPGDAIRVGALTTHAELAPTTIRRRPALARQSLIARSAIRNPVHRLLAFSRPLPPSCRPAAWRSKP
jgi:CO/xanthine dehydrogenase FAD-binding subunit